MPITNRNSLAQAEIEGMKWKKHGTPAWLKNMDFDKDDGYRSEESRTVHYSNFISMEEMKSWSIKKGDEEFEETHNDNDVWMTETKRRERENKI